MFSSLESVKKLDGTFGQNQRDADLQLTIDGVNAKIEDFLDRHLLIDEYIDVFDVYPTDSITYKLKGFPVSSIEHVKINDKELPETAYRINLKTGRLQIIRVIPPSVSTLEVSYTGGMAEDVEELRSKYKACVNACDMQCMFEFKRKAKLSVSSLAIKEGGTENMIPYSLLPEVKRALRIYRRKSLVG
jgi:hypothetical protein